MLEPGVERQLIKESVTSINIESTLAIHSEIWDDKYSVGLKFRLFTKDLVEKTITIGITSDTKWTEEVFKQYQDC